MGIEIEIIIPPKLQVVAIRCKIHTVPIMVIVRFKVVIALING